MTRLRSLTVALIALCVGATALHSPAAHASNAYDFYRWPWQYNSTYQMTQAWNGASSHFSSTGLYYAIDIAFNAQVMAAEEGSATCGFAADTFGYRVRITHGSDSSMYAHLDSCGFSGPTNVVQGYQVGHSGCTGTCDGTHLHFQVNTTTSSTISKAFSMSGVTPPNNGGNNCPCNYYTSDNNAAGYDTGLNFYSGVHDKYVSAGGWGTAGSTIALPYNLSPCLVSTPAVAGCTSNGYSGLVQTYKGAGSVGGGSEHGVLQRSGGSAVFMSRGLFYGYVQAWDVYSHQAMWYIGYPTGDSYYWYGVYRMDFQNGYATYSPSGCQSLWYQGTTWVKTYYYCD